MTDVQQPPPQQPWQAGPPPPQPAPPQPEPPKTNGLAIAAFILALVGLFASGATAGAVLVVLLCLAALGLGIAGVATARQPRSGRGLAIAAIVIACLGLIACLGAHGGRPSSSATSSTPSYSTPVYSAPTTPATQSLPAGTFGEGTYVVGTDIQPGTYRTTGAKAQGAILCAWWRLKDTTGDSGTILGGGNADGPTTATVKGSDGAVQFQGNCTWIKAG